MVWCGLLVTGWVPRFRNWKVNSIIFLILKLWLKELNRKCYVVNSYFHYYYHYDVLICQKNMLRVLGWHKSQNDWYMSLADTILCAFCTIDVLSPLHINCYMSLHIGWMGLLFAVMCVMLVFIVSLCAGCKKYIEKNYYRSYG